MRLLSSLQQAIEEVKKMEAENPSVYEGMPLSSGAMTVFITSHRLRSIYFGIEKLYEQLIATQDRLINNDYSGCE